MTDSNQAHAAPEQAAHKAPEEKGPEVAPAQAAAPAPATDGLENALAHVLDSAAAEGAFGDFPDEEPEYPVNPRYVNDGDNSRLPPALRPCPAGPTH